MYPCRANGCGHLETTSYGPVSSSPPFCELDESTPKPASFSICCWIRKGAESRLTEKTTASAISAMSGMLILTSFNLYVPPGTNVDVKRRRNRQDIATFQRVPFALNRAPRRCARRYSVDDRISVRLSMATDSRIAHARMPVSTPGQLPRHFSGAIRVSITGERSLPSRCYLEIIPAVKVQPLHAATYRQRE